MIHRPRARESKKLQPIRVSTMEDKWRRHKNKLRIWQRCVKKLALAKTAA
jgi:hypothetical protein